MREEGAEDRAIDIMRAFKWSDMHDLVEKKNTSALIVLYCDMRIGPHGILPMRERLENLKSRYTAYMDHETFLRCGLEVEKLIKSHISTDVESITEVAIAERFSSLFERSVG